LDTDAVCGSVSKTGRLLVVDEDYRDFGLSGELAARMLESGIALRYGRVCTEATIPYCRELEDKTLPHTEGIVSAALKLVTG
jgi:pyruvate/2-oxoglutarate/acetoin dehydrogenase E1 component